MRIYFLKRFLQIVPTILMITFVVFVMMQSIPGDPVVAMLGEAYTQEDADKVRGEYGLDQPVLVQYVIWLGKLVQGDWGRSILSGRPVLKDVLGPTLPRAVASAWCDAFWILVRAARAQSGQPAG